VTGFQQRIAHEKRSLAVERRHFQQLTSKIFGELAVEKSRFSKSNFSVIENPFFMPE
jgi:hypothetical protein